MSDDLHWLGAALAARRIATRDLSPVELVDALLTRIRALDPSINAFIRLDEAGARAAAADAEREIARSGPRGPLHGVPVGIKDIVDVAGHPTTCHSKVLLDNVAAADAAVVTRLRQAGAIILGKLSTHEFAIGGPSFDLPFPPARNPWNRDCHPGGSSSGSGAGLAAGFFPLAIGTDTGGSVRNPSSCCGGIGLKPTYGLVSRRGVFPLAFTLDHVGAMTRTVEDAALLLDAIAGHDAADPGSAARPYQPVTPRLGEGRKLRIGFVRHFHETDMPANPEVAAALEIAVQLMAREGHTIQDVTLPRLTDFSAVNRILLQAEAWSIHAPWLRTRPEDYGQLGRQRLAAGAFLSAGDYVSAQRHRTQMIAATQAAFTSVDVLLTASSMDPACRIDDAAEIARTYPRQARTPFNITGHPALAMTSGFNAAGLPLSLQFVAPYWDEITLLQAALAYERASGWSQHHPSDAQITGGDGLL